MDSLLWSLLGYVCLPLWLLAGLADYWAHRRTEIAHTSGRPETILHLVQTAQVGIPLLLVLFFEVNGIVLVLVALFAAFHTATAYWDIRYTWSRRAILPFEQLAHALLITLPLFATAILVVLHWPAATTLSDPFVLRQSLLLRDPPWDMGVIVAILAASTLFGVLPALAEFRDTLRSMPGKPT